MRDSPSISLCFSVRLCLFRRSTAFKADANVAIRTAGFCRLDTSRQLHNELERVAITTLDGNVLHFVHGIRTNLPVAPGIPVSTRVWASQSALFPASSSAPNLQTVFAPEDPSLPAISSRAVNERLGERPRAPFADCLRSSGKIIHSVRHQDRARTLQLLLPVRRARDRHPVEMQQPRRPEFDRFVGRDLTSRSLSLSQREMRTRVYISTRAFGTPCGERASIGGGGARDYGLQAGELQFAGSAPATGIPR